MIIMIMMIKMMNDDDYNNDKKDDDYNNDKKDEILLN